MYGCRLISGLEGSAVPDELFRANANVLDDLTQEDRREVARTMVGHGCLPAVGVPKLAVGPALSHL